jgi:hypothetical protein
VEGAEGPPSAEGPLEVKMGYKGGGYKKDKFSPKDGRREDCEKEIMLQSLFGRFRKDLVKYPVFFV